MKAIVVTGATAGIGYAVCEELIRKGFFVIGTGRSIKSCKTAQEKLVEMYGQNRCKFFWGELTNQLEILRLCDEITAYLDEHHAGRLFALINNAGCMRSWFSTSAEGYEQQFAVNHLAGFLITSKLMPCLIKARGRILFTSSKSHKLMKMHWNDIMYQKRYRPLYAYKQSKLCNVLTAYELNKRLSEHGIRAYAIDPGLVRTEIGNKDTGGLVNYVWRKRKKHGVSAVEAAQTYVYLCTAESPPEGLYFYKCKARKYNRQVNDKNASRLFELSERLCFLKHDACANRTNVLISGAAGGLGRIFALECAKRGYDLHLTDINEAGLSRIREGIEKQYDVRVYTHICDLSDSDDVGDMVKSILSDRKIDMLINVAGLDYEGAFVERSTDEIMNIINVNIGATMRLTHEVVKGRRENQPLYVIFVSSLAAMFPMPLKATYAASKRFLLDFSFALREELRADGGNALALCPGGLATTSEALSGIAAQGMAGYITTNRLEKIAGKTISRAFSGKSLYIPGNANQIIRVFGLAIPPALVAGSVFRRWKKAQSKWEYNPN